MKLSYVKKTLADVLREHPEYKTILLKFYHGLGDAIDFRANCLPWLKCNFPNRRFYFETQLGQEYLFEAVNPCERLYDLSVFISFLCAEWDPGLETKAEKCARVELGIEIPPDKEFFYHGIAHKPVFTVDSGLVGVHFVSTSNDGLCCPEPCARLIWEKIEKRGLIPIDTHFRHKGATIDRKVFPWETRNVQDIPATVKKLFNLLCGVDGFAGVASGNFWASLCCLDPEKILFIETEFPVRKLTHIPIKSVSAKDPDETVIDAWLDEITKGMNHV